METDTLNGILKAIGTQTYKLLVSPEELTSRVIERIEVLSSTIRRRTTIEYSEPLLKGTLVPLLVMRRGYLLNNFTIEQPAGALSTLNRFETQRIASVIIHHIAETVLRERELSTSAAGAELIKALSDIPSSPPLTSLSLVQAIEKLARTRVGDVAITASSDEYAKCLALLATNTELVPILQFFRSNRILLVKATANLQKITFCRDLPSQAGVHPSRRETVRAALGQFPFEIILPVPVRLRPHSYHFRLDSPAGQYIRSAEFKTLRFSQTTRGSGAPYRWETTPFEIQTDASGGPSLSTEGSQNQPDGFAHLYLGGLNNSLPKFPLYASVKYNERPLGSIGSTLVRSALVLAIVATVPAIGSRLVGGSPSSSDAVALLITLPGLLNLATGTRVDANPYAPLISKIGTLVSGFASICGALLFLWWSAIANDLVHEAERNDLPRPSIGIPTGVGRGYFVIITLLSLLVCLLGWRLVAGIIRFTRTVRHAEGGSFADPA